MHVAREGLRNHAERLDAPQNVLVHERAVLDAVPGVGPGPEPLDALVRVQHHVDRAIAVRVDHDLKVVTVRALDALVNLLLRHRENAVVVGTTHVGCAHRHRPTGGRAVRGKLRTAHLEPLVSETAVNAGLDQPVESFGAPAGHAPHHHVDPETHLSRVIGVLVGDDIVHPRGAFVNRGQPRRRHSLGDELDTRLTLGACASGRPYVIEQVVRGLGDLSRQPTTFFIDVPSGRVRGVDGDARDLEGSRVVPVNVSPTMGHEHGSVGHRVVQVVDIDLAALANLRVVILEAEHPRLIRRLRGLFAQGVLDLRDGPDVQIGAHELSDTAARGMDVAVDEPRCHRHPLGVDDLGARRYEIPDVVAAPDRDEPIAMDRERLGSGLIVVDGENATVEEYEIRPVGGPAPLGYRVRPDPEPRSNGGAPSEEFSARVSLHGRTSLPHRREKYTTTSS